MKLEIGEELVEPTMSEQDIFMRWVTLIADTSAIWNPEFYGAVHSIGTVFGRPAEMRYTYVLGNSFADIHVQAKEDEPDSQVRFKIFVQKLQGVQVHVQHGSGEIFLDASKPTNFQMYDLQALVNFIQEQLK